MKNRNSTLLRIAFKELDNGLLAPYVPTCLNVFSDYVYNNEPRLYRI